MVANDVCLILSLLDHDFFNRTSLRATLPADLDNCRGPPHLSNLTSTLHILGQSKMPYSKTGGLVEELKADITARLASTQRLFDKVDTLRWLARDREGFEALVDKKRQIEKQRHKNAMNDIAARQRTLMSADLKAKDNDFNYDQDTVGYKFTSTANKCTMDGRYGSCHHERCMAAKGDGIP